MPLTEKIFLGTWKFDETIRDQAAIEAFFGTEEEANEWSAYAPDVLEFKMQGDNTYLEGGLYRHRFFLQVTARDPEIDLFIQYYIRSEGDWSYDASKNLLSEVTTNYKVLCMDEGTEEETRNSEDLGSLFDSSSVEAEQYSVQFISEQELRITDTEINLRFHLRRVPLEPALGISK